MEQKGKELVLCFLVGGCYGAIGQVIGTSITSVVGTAFAGPLTLICLGALAIAMYVPGIHQRIARVSGFGSILPFNGFACGIADAYQGGCREAGSARGGLAAVGKLFLHVVVLGGAICMAAGLIAAYVPLPSVETPQVSFAYPVALALAFAIAGAVCVLFQVILYADRFAVPDMLLAGLAGGGILAAFGIMDWIGAYGGFGFSILATGAGQAVTATTRLLAETGDPTMLLVVWGVFVALVIIGIVCGVANKAVEHDDSAR